MRKERHNTRIRSKPASAVKSHCSAPHSKTSPLGILAFTPRRVTAMAAIATRIEKVSGGLLRSPSPLNGERVGLGCERSKTTDFTV